MNYFLRLRMGILAAVIAIMSLSPLAAQRTGSTTLAQKANTHYEQAESMLKARKFPDAQELFEQFTKKYFNSHLTPKAYGKLAYCALKNGDTKAFDAAVDACTKKYTTSPESFYAYGAWLKEARRRDDKKLYIQIFVAMLNKTRTLMPNLPSFSVGSHHNVRFDIRQKYESVLYENNSALNCAFNNEGWHRDLLWATQEQLPAKQALGALDRTFRECAGDLSPELQYVHYRLLTISGNGKLAEKKLGSYMTAWGKDTRGIRLRLMVLWDDKIESKKSTHTEEIWNDLLTNYIRFHSMRDWTQNFIKALAEKNDFPSCLALTKAFFDSRVCWEWRHASHLRPRLTSTLLGLARKKPQAEEGDRFAPTIKFLRDYMPTLKDDQKDVLSSIIDLQISSKKQDEAVKTATELLENNWSASSSDKIERLGRSNPAFKKVFDAAWTKMGLSDKASPEDEKKAYSTFREKLRDDRVKFADELAEAMLKKSPKSEQTVLAAWDMANYYFNKLMPKERDIWAEHMARHFAKHPLTEKAMLNQITAAKTARDPKMAAKWLDLISENFPGSESTYWVADRLWCFKASEDSAGRWSKAQEFFAPAAKAGSVFAQASLVINEFKFKNPESRKDNGDFWFAQGKKYKGTRLEVKCYRRAFDEYFSIYARDSNDYAGAVKTAKAIQDQKYDEESSWRFAFEDINTIAHKGDAPAALKAFAKARISKCRDLSLRLSLPLLGTTIGKDGKGSAGTSHLKKLQSLCTTPRDKIAFGLMMGNLLARDSDDRKKLIAAKYYFSVAKDARFPAQVVDIFHAGINAYPTKGDIRALSREANDYINRIKFAQSILPELLNNLGNRYLRVNSPLANGIKSQLVRYSASTYKDKFDEAYRKALEKLNKRKR